jgi:hypothetical protein
MLTKQKYVDIVMYIVSARKKWYAAILEVYWSGVGKLTPCTPGFLLN